MAKVWRIADSRRGKRTSFTVFLVILLAVGLTFSCWTAISSVVRSFAGSRAYDAVILRASQRNGIDPALVKAVIWRESRFNPNARGRAGEIGLMQIMPEQAVVDWAKYYNRPVPTRGALAYPELNIEIGTWYLGNAVRRWSRFKYGTELALCEYNAGLRRAMTWRPAGYEDDVRPRITISSTLAYVNDIMKKYERYRRDRFGRENKVK